MWMACVFWIILFLAQISTAAPFLHQICWQTLSFKLLLIILFCINQLILFSTVSICRIQTWILCMFENSVYVWKFRHYHTLTLENASLPRPSKVCRPKMVSCTMTMLIMRKRKQPKQKNNTAETNLTYGFIFPLHLCWHARPNYSKDRHL